VDELRGTEMSPLTDLPMRLATTADAPLVTRLLKAFFSHEGRVVPHLSENVEANFLTRAKMGQSSDVYAVAIANDGKAYYAKKDIKVTLGGCGG